MKIHEEVLNILKTVKPTKNLENVKDIIEGGYLDSFELVMLITSLSEKFNIEVTIDEIVPENFNSAEAITNMVELLLERKQQKVLVNET